MFRRLFKRENGDTIVEVLIAMAILALVLGGAYYTANQSFRNDRDSQEHSEALTVAQTQIEALRTYVLTQSQSFTSDGDCLNTTGPSLTPTGPCYMSGGSSTVYSTQSNCMTGDNVPYCYNVTITCPSGSCPTATYVDQTQDPAGIPLDSYKVTVTWPALGSGTDEVDLYYRVES